MMRKRWTPTLRRVGEGAPPPPLRQPIQKIYAEVKKVETRNAFRLRARQLFARVQELVVGGGGSAHDSSCPSSPRSRRTHQVVFL